MYQCFETILFLLRRRCIDAALSRHNQIGLQGAFLHTSALTQSSRCGCAGALTILQQTTLTSTAGLLTGLQALTVNATSDQLATLAASTVASTSNLLAALQALTVNATNGALTALQDAAISNVTQTVRTQQFVTACTHA